MTRKEAVSNFLKKAKLAYIDDQRDKKIRASGASAESLKENPEDTGGTLTGADYFYFQKHGRKPGKFPPIESIIQWLKDKSGFNVQDERGPGLKSLAFLIARKIAKKGTDIYQQKRPGLSVEDKILEARKELVGNIAQIAKEKILEGIKKQQSK